MESIMCFCVYICVFLHLTCLSNACSSGDDGTTGGKKPTSSDSNESDKDSAQHWNTFSIYQIAKEENGILGYTAKAVWTKKEKKCGGDEFVNMMSLEYSQKDKDIVGVSKIQLGCSGVKRETLEGEPSLPTISLQKKEIGFTDRKCPDETFVSGVGIYFGKMADTNRRRRRRNFVLYKDKIGAAVHNPYEPIDTKDINNFEIDWGNISTKYRPKYKRKILYTIPREKRGTEGSSNSNEKRDWSDIPRDSAGVIDLELYCSKTDAGAEVNAKNIVKGHGDFKELRVSLFQGFCPQIPMDTNKKVSKALTVWFICGFHTLNQEAEENKDDLAGIIGFRGICCPKKDSSKKMRRHG